MAFGPVNSPGSEIAELEDIRRLAQTANDTANAAKNTATTAKQTADAALEAANGAVTEAGNAKTAADEAKELAQGVSSTASEALKKASAAEETANGVSSKVDEALQAAQNAQQSASAALDAVKKLTSTINAVPSQSGTLTYSGSPQTPSWNNYDPEQLTITITAQTNAGTYNATFTPKGEYEWAEGGKAAKTVQWTIKRATVTLPAQSGTPTYTGNAITPTWNANYDANKMTVSVTSQTNAGSYSASFTPKDNYQWSDGSTAAKSVTWSIGKAAGSFSLNPTSMSLDVSNLTKNITVTRAGDGAISASSSNASIASVQVSGTTVTVTAKAKGSVDVTVSVAAGTNHTAPASQKCTVTVTMPSTSLADNTPATIQAEAKAGTASNYWNVGDKIPIKVNGSFGGLSYNDTVYAVILGFNHNSSVEGNNSIHFQIGKNASGTDIAFVQDYGSTGKGFCMNTTNTNANGWSGSYMRGTICAAFLNALPTEWKNVIVACTKYSDNKGGGSDTASNVSSTSDKIWLLAEFEVFGTRSGANSAEQNYQKQYDYYKNGNSKVRYQHSATTSACNWWLRSVHSSLATTFRLVNTGGRSAGNYAAYYSYGFAPGFKVA